MRLLRFSSESAWIEEVLAEFERAIAARGASAGRGAAAPRGEAGAVVHLCLAGGSTPAPAYRAMAALPLRGVRIELWPGDERLVPASDPARNGSMIAAAFEDCAWDPPPRLRLWPEAAAGAGPAEALEACSRYAAELEEALGPRPSFDLALLGLGDDGHTASLFPGDPILGERRLLARPSAAPVAPRLRTSLTYPALRETRCLRFLARGPGKRSIVERLAAAAGSADSLPAAGIGAADEAILFCEE